MPREGVIDVTWKGPFVDGRGGGSEGGGNGLRGSELSEKEGRGGRSRMKQFNR